MQAEVIRNVTWRGGGSQQKMKTGAVHAVLRRSLTTNISSPRKAGSSPERSSVIIGPGPLIRILLHIFACVASLVIGFRFSRETLLVLVLNQPELSLLRTTPLTRLDSSTSSLSSDADVAIKFPYVVPSGDAAVSREVTKSSRVHVGRHEILVRPWPHPDRAELHKAHALLQRVQREQRSIYGPRRWRTVIAITPTFARTFQAIHLQGVMHTLRAVSGSVVWLVVEAGGRSNETAALLAASNLDFVHLGVKKQVMPFAWEQRRRVETRLRVEGLRHVRREKLDGLILFADDSNVHSLQLFDEVQKVNWIGALSVGLLETSTEEEPPPDTAAEHRRRLPVQGPACNETCHVVGWHALRAAPVDGEREASLVSAAGGITSDAGGITDVASHLEWSGFVINSRAVWEGGSEDEEIPGWINDWSQWISEDGSLGSPLRLAKEQGLIEPLGSCGREVLLWWVRVEARSDSRYPPRWVMESPLEITVDAKRTPWPEYVEPKETGGGSRSSRKVDPADKHRSGKAQRTSGRRKRRQENPELQQQQQPQKIS